MPKDLKMWAELEKWANDFDLIGHPLRLSIVLILYGSEVLRGRECLTAKEISEILGLPKTQRAQNSLNYHIGKLIMGDFVERKPLQEREGKSKVITIYHLGTKAHEFLEDFKMTGTIEEFLKQYPSAL